MIQFNYRKQKLGFFMTLFSCLMIFKCQVSNAQTTAGNAVYNFLELPNSAKISALGGLNISSIGNDLGLAMYNPSLLSPDMENQFHIGIKPYFAGIQQYDLLTAKYGEQKNLTWGLGVHYLDYGNINMTDIAGNDIGWMHPNDYAVQVSAARDYMPNIRIGTTFKYIHSNYGLYKSSAVAMDIGLKYLSSNNLSQVSLLVKNLGMQIGSETHKQDLPFNLILGWTKKMEFAPFQFSLTADRLSVWNNSYYDPVYAQAQTVSKPTQLQNVFNHLTIGTEVFIGQQVDLNLGYNIMRRYDLNIQDQANGLNGFSAGIGLKLERINFQYGSSFFQSNLYHHFSLTYQLKK